MQKIKTQIAEELKKQIDLINPDTGLDAEAVSLMMEYPPDKTLGDLALPCFKLSRSLRRSPVQIATQLAEGLSCDAIAECKAVNGYLNIFISNDFLSAKVVSEILAKGDDYGKNDVGEGRTVVLDYSSPNVAKPFHLGHLGTTVIGHSLRRLFEFAGYKCIGVNHLGDWGTSFGKQIVALKTWGDTTKIEENGVDGLVTLYQKFHEEAEARPELFDEARAEFTKLENGDPENTELWKRCIAVSIAEYQKTYAQLDIEFDYYTGESFYTDKMPAQVERMREKGLLKLDDGASIVDLADYNMPPCLILKRDGSTLYPTRDISAAVYRHDTFDFDRCVYVTSAGQSLHFAQWFKVVELMGYDWANKLVHVPYGTMSIGGAKLGTRSGNVVWLKQLLNMSIDKVRDVINEKNPDLPNKEQVAEEVGVGAIVFNYLLNSRIKDISFDLEAALDFNGNTGPYVQYTYARCCSILEKATAIPESVELSLTEESESALVKTLSRFPEKVNDALSQYEPSVITRYILDVASAFNRFYHDCQILSADDEKIRNTRILLTKATKTVLGNAFGLICLKKPEKI
ncbi:MAG: arginine--tRNA ligase [Ruminococcaceae bacterium]|nr:arginine--tRNA ligase [Oscillospiraceae bacterium]